MRGRRYWKRQIEPQLVPIAPVKKADVLNTRFPSAFSSPAGFVRNFLYFGSEKRA